MDPTDKFADLKTLARMVARLAGREPDERGSRSALETRWCLAMSFGDTRNFMARVEAAHELLHRGIGFEPPALSAGILTSGKAYMDQVTALRLLIFSRSDSDETSRAVTRPGVR